MQGYGGSSLEGVVESTSLRVRMPADTWRVAVFTYYIKGDQVLIS